MPQQITNIQPTTETEAVNAMLSAIGEAPVADASTATQADVAMALNLLRNATRELQSKPWRFNYEIGLELCPVDTVTWVDTSGVSTVLNVFQVPSGVSSWRMTKCSENGDLDLVARPAKQYTAGVVHPLVLYDRAYNRDGAAAAQYPHVYVDAVFTFDFEQLPETARRLVTVTAGRRFTQQIVGSQSLAGFAEGDEALARRIFQQDQTDETELNMLNSATAFSMLGKRPRPFAGTLYHVRPGNELFCGVVGVGGTGGTGGTGGSGGSASFPTADLMALYDADAGVTTTLRPSSDTDAYSWLQADAAYNAALTVADQSGHGNLLAVTGAFGPMRRLNILNGHATLVSQGGGQFREMRSTASAGMPLTAATIFAVCRPSYANTTSNQEFGLWLDPDPFVGATGGLFGGTYSGQISAWAGYNLTTTNLLFGSGWTGQAQNGTPFDIVVLRWDGTTATAYKNGLAIGTSQAFTGPTQVSSIACLGAQVEWAKWAVWNRALTTTEIASIFSTQGALYGIAVS